jgi:hypothetical protein
MRLRSIKLIFIVFISFTLAITSYGQSEERCATEPFNEMLRQRGQILQERIEFEEWVQKKISEKKQRQLFGIEDETSEASQTIVIPVVVHIIHNGEAIGSGTNVPDAQVISQIKVLNQDFRRENADANQTPSEFVSVAGSWDISFVLAKRDPEGLPTNGITRTRGTKSIWQFADDTELKSLSYWPAEDYLNIWVCDLAGLNTGYAQLPVSNLPGLEVSSENRLTDGIVVDFRYFGSIDDGNFNINSNFNKGRTASHEVGHFFGLLHIWGLSTSCNSSDFVSDTPVQEKESTGCPTHPRVSCNSNDMFQNYMDYTVDRCMNLFTAGQVERMKIILENSPRRTSLMSSLGAEIPVLFNVDLGIRKIINPAPTACPDVVIPQIELRNYGNNPINSATINFSLNGNLIQSLSTSLNLAPLETSVLNFNAIQLPGNLTSMLTFHIQSVNGGVDENNNNNTLNLNVKTPAPGSLPFLENFDLIPTNWQIINPDNKITWQSVNAPKVSTNNRAAFIDFYTNENEGERDYLVSPLLDFRNLEVAFLDFEYAYARYPNINLDSLLVIVSTNCNFQFGADGQEVVFRKGGSELATANTTSSFYIPAGASDWKKVSINLNTYIGEQFVQIAFVGLNGYGNNLYLDNVALVVSEQEDIGIDKIVSPGLVSCNQRPQVLINVQNTGTVLINSFSARLKINNNIQNFNFNNVQLQPLEERLFSLTVLNLTNGIYDIEVELLNPNGREDQNPSNNKFSSKFAINTSREMSPLKLDFSNGITDEWTNISPELGLEWTLDEQEQYIFFNGWNNNTAGTTAWLVSPRINFFNTTKASLFFDVSYGYTPSKGNETLQVLLSEDCGRTYNRLVYQRTGNALATSLTNEQWLPGNWRREFINLNSVAGLNDVRIAFVVTNGQGNNLYINNIEVYNDDVPNPPKIDDLYSLYSGGPEGDDFKLTFNFDNKQDVKIDVYDATGRQMFSKTELNVLNQTFGITLPGKPSGMFIIHLRSQALVSARKIYIQR